jgi:putative Holliday junction resolvase
MPLFNMSQLRASLPRDARLLGLDPGSRTIGLALSDVSLILASPYGSLRRSRLSVNAAEIARIAWKEGAAGLVCGFPLSMDGSLGPAAQRVRDWLLALADVTGLPSALWDERLSSSAVNRMLISDLDMTRSRRAALVDKLAAAYILQAALDASAA